MPFKSEKQRRFLWAEHPDIAKRWARKYPKSNKDLPMYANTDSNKKAALSALSHALTSVSGAAQDVNNAPASISILNTSTKESADGLMYVKLPKKHGPSYAGQEEESGADVSEKTENPSSCEHNALDVKDPVAQKLAVVLGPKLREVMEQQIANEQGRQALPVPQNLGLKRYAVNPAAQVMPPGFGMTQPPAQPQQANSGPVGGGSNPATNPINSYGPLSQSGVINGNAAFGQKNSPDSLKAAAAKDEPAPKRKSRSPVYLPTKNMLRAGAEAAKYELKKLEAKEASAGSTPCSCGCGDTVSTCKCGPDCKCRKPGGSCYKAEKSAGTPAWQRSEGKNPEGGLNAKGRASYKAQTGGTLKAPVTESNPSGERAKRQNSFCSRMCGMKRVNTGAKTKSDPDSRINKSLRKWNCKCSSAYEFGQQVKEAAGWGETLGNFAQGLGTSWNNASRVFKGGTGAIAGGLGAAGAGLTGVGMQGANAVGGLFGAKPFSNETVNTAYGTAGHFANMGKAYGQDLAQGLGMGEHGLAGTTMNTPSRGDQYVQQVQNLPGVTPQARAMSQAAMTTADMAAKAAPAAAIGGSLQMINNAASAAPIMKGVSSFAPTATAAPAATATSAAPAAARAAGGVLEKVTGVGSKLNSTSNPLGYGTSAGINAVRSYQDAAQGAGIPAFGKAGAAWAFGQQLARG